MVTVSGDVATLEHALERDCVREQQSQRVHGGASVGFVEGFCGVRGRCGWSCRTQPRSIIAVRGVSVCFALSSGRRMG
jgi:hypothetical protein